VWSACWNGSPLSSDDLEKVAERGTRWSIRGVNMARWAATTLADTGVGRQVRRRVGQHRSIANLARLIGEFQSQCPYQREKYAYTYHRPAYLPARAHASQKHSLERDSKFDSSFDSNAHSIRDTGENSENV
jgi:hypothetical protein